MKKEIDMGIFLEDDARYADAVNVFGNMPKGTVTEEAVEPYDTKLHAVGTFLLPRSRAWQEGTSLQQRERTPLQQRRARQEGTSLQQRRKRLTTKHRDMVRRVIFGVNFVITELELQETVDYSYPLRDMGYTFGEYEQQARKIRRLVRRAKKQGKSTSKSSADLRPGEYLYGFRKESRLSPTVIFLLYFGEEPWDGPTCIHDMLDFTDIPNEMHALVQNHRINLIDVRRMSDEMLDRFQTDVGKVLRVIKNAENKEELKKLIETDPYYKEMEQDAYLVTANYIKADELLDYEKYEENGGRCDMCRAIKELIKDGRMEGRKEGLAAGREEGFRILADLVSDNVVNANEVAKRMGMTETEFLKLVKIQQSR